MRLKGDIAKIVNPCVESVIEYASSGRRITRHDNGYDIVIAASLEDADLQAVRARRAGRAGNDSAEHEVARIVEAGIVVYALKRSTRGRRGNARDDNGGRGSA